MDQGVIYAAKTIYRRRFLNEVLVVMENEEDIDNDTRGQRTFRNLKAYNIRAAIFNWAAAWSEVSNSTVMVLTFVLQNLKIKIKKILCKVEIKKRLKS